MLNRITRHTADIHRGAAIMLSRIHAAQECDATKLIVAPQPGPKSSLLFVLKPLRCPEQIAYLCGFKKYIHDRCKRYQTCLWQTGIV